MKLQRGPVEIAGDVVVIGAGAAATMAAIEAKRHDLEVVLIDKDKLGYSGTSPRCGGGGNDWALLPPELGGDPLDSHDAQLHDCVTGGEYLNQQEMTELFNVESFARMVECESLGVVYRKNPDGTYGTRKIMAFTRARGVGRAQGGAEAMMQAMRQQVLARGIRVHEGVIITKLIKAEGRVVGALGLNTKTGEFYLFRGKAFVLAAGSATGLYKYPTCENEVTGDAYQLAYHAGAELMNMEFLQFSLVAKIRDIVMRDLGGIKPLTHAGARWVNALGERIMEKYDPQRLELTDWWRHAYAIHKENAEGRGPVLLDLSALPEDQREIWEYAPYSPCKTMKNIHLDPKREKIGLLPGLHTFLGGARINERAETTVPGLFAAGESAGQGGIFGADRVGGGIPAAQVIGHRAGQYAALFSAREGIADCPRGEISEAQDAVASLVRDNGEDPYDVEDRIKDVALDALCISRTGERLERAVDFYAQCRKDAPSIMRAANLVDLRKAIEVSNLALAGEIVSRSALMRAESRGQHRREDYPARDDKNWLKWIVVSEDHGQMSMSTRPVPFEKYKVKPS